MKSLVFFLLLLSSLGKQLIAQDTLSFTKTEIIYGRKDGMALTMIMLTPKKNANGKAIIKVVSGSWVSTYDRIPVTINRSTIYLNRGYTVYAVMHGSQPRYAIPDEVADLKRAVRFIRYNADEYHINKNSIGITGSSSGGHLSLMVALSDDKIDTASKDPINHISSRVQAAAVFYPPTDFLNWGQPNRNLAEAKKDLAIARVVSAFEYKERNDIDRTYKLITDSIKQFQITKQISPVYSVTADDPPVFIIHGDADRTVPIQQSETLVKKLNDAHVQNRFIIKEGGGHGWKNEEIEEKNFVDWFDKYLK